MALSELTPMQETNYRAGIGFLVGYCNARSDSFDVLQRAQYRACIELLAYVACKSVAQVMADAQAYMDRELCFTGS